MIRLVEFTKPLNEYDDFILCHSSKTDKWMLIGEWDDGDYDINCMHYIAISDSEEELRVWIDLRNIILKKVVEHEYECWSIKRIYKYINRKR